MEKRKKPLITRIINDYIDTFSSGWFYKDFTRNIWVNKLDRSAFFDISLKQIDFKFQIKTLQYRPKKPKIKEIPLKEIYQCHILNDTLYELNKYFPGSYIRDNKFLVKHHRQFVFEIESSLNDMMKLILSHINAIILLKHMISTKKTWDWLNENKHTDNFKEFNYTSAIELLNKHNKDCSGIVFSKKNSKLKWLINSL